MLAVIVGTAVVSMPGFQFCDADLNSVPQLLRNDRFVLAFGNKDVGIGIIPAGTALGVPTGVSCVYRIPKDVFYGTIFKSGSTVGGVALGVEPFGKLEKAFAGIEALIDLKDYGTFDIVRDKPAVFHLVAEGRCGLGFSP